MSPTDRISWFANLQTKAEMNTLAIGIIEEIMGHKGTTIPQKVLEIACTLRDLNRAWGAKEAPAPTGAKGKNDHLDCSINLDKVESLVDKTWAEEFLKK